MKHHILIIALISSFFSFSQSYVADMLIRKSELQATTYSKDSTANALVIYDYGNSFVNKKTFWLNSQFKQKIKILKPEGIDRGEFEIILYKGKSTEEKIEDIKGTTYNLENGKIVKTHLTEKAVFREENEKFTRVKFVLPNVKVGSIITVSYEKQSRFMAKYQPWYFQGQDPVLYSEYNTSIPGNYIYHIKLVGSIPFTDHKTSLEKHCLETGRGASADCGVSKYVMENIPAYKPEDYTTTSLNYTSRIEYELSVFNGFDGRIDKITKTWKDADKELKVDPDFGKQLSKNSLVKDVLPMSITSITDQLKKAKAIYQFVLDNYIWNRKTERYDVSVKNLIKEKVGSVFEINMLLENLLTSQGIETFPVLMSTRGNGFATKIYPVLTDFNYLILKTTIDQKNYFIDATNKYHTFGELPFRALNQYGRLIDFEIGSYWEDIEVKPYSSQTHRVEINSSLDNEFTGRVQSRYTGYHSHQPKQDYDENPTSYLNDKINDLTEITIEDHEVIDFKTSKSNFSETYNITIEPEFIGDKIYLNPFIIKFFEENPFKLQERSYPIDFGYKDIYSYNMQIKIDEGFKILEIPEKINYSLPNSAGSVIFNLEQKDNTIIVYFKVKFNLPIYAPDYYPYLKLFMDKVVELQNNSVIVLEKQ
ncbi:DUF3857 domain-containing protein [Winogradskyella endarachnes]|uniref:DUF3857 domain-containing protein n=1 Tax=Winogradskyella endarachnes TaxID=2681965 RepID=A0A6L6U495_9FLAO|nr:DUF3857 domain-containing protein [Winogradskyella endarachnes]MUU76861.1 DUF3857 domain-containing protein [Winogradskyella endarachnes]